MKILSIVSGMFCALFIGTAGAADITIYHSPTCPHCHHARDWFKSGLIYEYPNLIITEVDVMDTANRDMFMDTLKKCEFSSGGVPVIVVGEKCFQGYGDRMQNDIRTAVEVGLPESDIATAQDNRKAMAENHDAFIQSHSDRLNSIIEYKPGNVVQKKNDLVTSTAQTSGNIYWYILLLVAVVVLGIVLVRGNKK